MKSISKWIKLNFVATFVVSALICLNTLVIGQSAIPLPQINARFSNPQYNNGTRMYYLDVELNSVKSSEFLFGMNVRFFFDASLLDFRYFDQYSDGFGPLGDPVVIQANGTSGLQMFGLKNATSFVNGTVQLQNEQSHLEIPTNIWVKAFRVCFKVPPTVPTDKAFCPAVIWDIKPKVGSGFLNGDDGLVITIIENDPKTPDVSKPAFSAATSLNWQASSLKGGPFGNPVSTTCISLAKVGLRSETDLSPKEYELLQNEPNPFDHGTVIQFTLPVAQKVSLKFYDVTGKILKEIVGDYKEGKNAVNLGSEPWMQGAKVVLYRMETEGFRSKMFKMVFINE